ncbi:redoxin domain-containing protein [Haloferax larsenii]|uniref:Peroxiredoxin n=1 Tax=Haloferax larsenii TaxID=302484 RepID=A0A1H7IB98_HALLR|nr:redoxin domain-containing protein [Haloferax larsenii]ELZ82785.1 peroxiredoxin-like protein [Haloferax larsenii JCM 13917]UVE49356.1 redoxin domain-containing protein [Haloferax larsenii]SEK59017.1 Peroxiredoxin [Haloferax larsenii]
MVSVGDTAPDFTAPKTDIDGDIEEFTLSENLDDAPIVLAFFPAAFTGVCTTEMCTFRDQMANFDDVGATVYGISIDTPFTLSEFAEKNDLNFDLISDTNRNIIDAFGIDMDFADLGVYNVAKRAVFVVNADGEVTYEWVSDDPGVEPDYDEVEAAASEAEAEAPVDSA